MNFDQYSSSDITAKLQNSNREKVNLAIQYNAAVLIPFLRKNNHWHLLFIHRSTLVNSHKDQVSFPGGTREQRDADVVETALRETREEIGVADEQVRILGQLSSIRSRKDYVITPIVGEIPWPTQIKTSKDEVDHYFTIPLNWLADDANLEIKPYPVMDGSIGKVYFYCIYKGELLWGISAKIVVDLIVLLKKKAAE